MALLRRLLARLDPGRGGIRGEPMKNKSREVKLARAVAKTRRARRALGAGRGRYETWSNEWAALHWRKNGWVRGPCNWRVYRVEKDGIPF